MKGIYTGRAKKVEVCELVDTANLLEQMSQRSYDYAEENAEEYLIDVSEEDEESLKHHVATWFIENGHDTDLYKVVDITFKPLKEFD